MAKGDTVRIFLQAGPVVIERTVVATQRGGSVVVEQPTKTEPHLLVKELSLAKRVVRTNRYADDFVLALEEELS